MKAVKFFCLFFLLTRFGYGQLILEPFVTNVNQVTEITHCGDDRLFIAEQPGVIKVSDLNGNLNPVPFLDISSQVTTGNEMGLLGLAFSPDYKINGNFYVNYIDLSQNTIVSRFRVLQGNPDMADPLSEEVLISLPQPYPNHNGGSMHFGPDGYLYIALGDGGAGGDPGNRAQNLMVLFGKILRIDVSASSGYSIPSSNPFVGDPNADDHIWASGLRNPWRISFDRLKGDLWIADVGQNLYEEVNFQPASSLGGENYGWRCYEANHEFNLTGCLPASSYVFPVYESEHFPYCSVTGGYVYRGGEYATGFGKYIFTDYCYGHIIGLSDSSGVFVEEDYGPFQQFVFSTFGEDKYGELYIGRTSSGVDKITFADCKPVAYTGTTDTILHPYSTYKFTTPRGRDLIYQWYYNGEPIIGATNNSYEAGISGKYKVVVAKNDSCFNISREVVLILGQQAGFYISPNPANDVTQIVWGLNMYGQKEITVFDITGRKCVKESVIPNSISYQLNTRNFANGLYIVTVKYDGGEVSRKLIISGK